MWLRLDQEIVVRFAGKDAHVTEPTRAITLC